MHVREESGGMIARVHTPSSLVRERERERKRKRERERESEQKGGRERG